MVCFNTCACHDHDVQSKCLTVYLYQQCAGTAGAEFKPHVVVAGKNVVPLFLHCPFVTDQPINGMQLTSVGHRQLSTYAATNSLSGCRCHWHACENIFCLFLVSLLDGIKPVKLNFIAQHLT